MNVCLDGVGHLEVDDETNVLDVDTTTSKVGRDKHIGLSIPEGLQRGLTLLLVLAGVESSGTELN